MWQRCPVCNGNGLVSGGFYNHPCDVPCVSNCTVETCRACAGKGIIAEPEYPVKVEYFKIPDVPKGTGG